VIGWWGAVGAAALVAVVVLAGIVPAIEGDVPGSADHPIVPRLPFATIVHYEHTAAGTYPLVLGPLPSDEATVADVERQQVLTGKVTRIQYMIDSNQRGSDVYFQYDYRIGRMKFETLVERKGPPTRAPGGSVWLAKVFAPLGEAALEPLVKSTIPSQRRFYAGRRAGEEGEVYLVMVVNDHGPRDVRVQLDIIEID
jgi:hypothetical protein